MKDSKDENELLLETIKKFMADEIYPHEEAVDKLGYVPTEIANQIEKKAFANAGSSVYPNLI